MNVQTFLNRINYTDDIEPTSTNLHRLHQAHLLSVPFENLDIHIGRKIILDRERIFEKVVTNRRGGFCYEINGLFGWLLEQLGYDVTILSARSNPNDGELGVEHDHLMMLVKCPADPEDINSIPWLADIGWGENFYTPKRLDEIGVVQNDALLHYRIDEAENRFYNLYQQNLEGVWERQYRFSLQAHAYTDFAPGCHHHQTSPESHFPKKKVCTLAKPDGRITLTDDKFIVTKNGQKESRPITAEEFDAILLDEFGITLTD